MEKGFTLVEILIVVSLLAIAAVIVIPNLRKFNDDQDLTSSASNLKQSLRLAQSSAVSGIKCSVWPTTGWKVSIKSGQFYITALCFDPSGATTPSSEVRPTTTLPSSVTILSDNCGTVSSTTADEILFSDSSVNFNCKDGSTANSPFIVTLKSLKNNQTQAVTVESGGLIY